MGLKAFAELDGGVRGLLTGADATAGKGSNDDISLVCDLHIWLCLRDTCTLIGPESRRSISYSGSCVKSVVRDLPRLSHRPSLLAGEADNLRPPPAQGQR